MPSSLATQSFNHLSFAVITFMMILVLAFAIAAGLPRTLGKTKFSRKAIFELTCMVGLGAATYISYALLTSGI